VSLVPDPKFDLWHGVNRREIEWYPTIDEEKCKGSGICVTSCGRGVFRYDYMRGKAKVVYPYNCMVGCQTCGSLCPKGALSFSAGREKVQQIVAQWDILSRVKEELEARREELEFRSE